MEHIVNLITLYFVGYLQDSRCVTTGNCYINLHVQIEKYLLKYAISSK